MSKQRFILMLLLLLLMMMVMMMMSTFIAHDSINLNAQCAEREGSGGWVLGRGGGGGKS